MKHTRILQAVALALVASAVACVDIDEKLITGVSSQYYATPDGLNSAARSRATRSSATSTARSSCSP